MFDIDNLDNLWAKFKDDGKEYKVKIINIANKEVNLHKDDDGWGKWYNYSKRGDVELFIREFYKGKKYN